MEIKQNEKQQNTGTQVPRKTKHSVKHDGRHHSNGRYFPPKEDAADYPETKTSTQATNSQPEPIASDSMESQQLEVA